MVKGLVELAAATPGLTEYVSQSGFRIFFLHAYLLGAVSFAVIYAVRSEMGEGAFRGALPFVLAEAVVLFLLVMFPAIVLFLPSRM